MKKKIPAWIILTVFCLVAASALALTNLLTKDVIKANSEKESMQARLALLPGSATFEDLENGVSVGKDAEGNIIGYAGVGTASGFGGPVETTVVVYPDGTIAGISVGGDKFAETAGLGAKAKEPEFQMQFAGKTAPAALSKNGGEIDAISGATITSKAVITGVNAAVTAIAEQAGLTVDVLPEEMPAEESAADGKATGLYTLYNATGENVKEVSLTDNGTNEKTIVATDLAADATVEVQYNADASAVLSLQFTTESGYTGNFDKLHIETAPITLLPESAVDAVTHATMIEFKAMKLGKYTLYNLTGENIREVSLTNNETQEKTVVATDMEPGASAEVKYLDADNAVLTLSFTTESGYTGVFATLHMETAPVSLLAVDAASGATAISFSVPEAQ